MDTARKLWRLLTREQRRATLVQLALTLIGMVLETLSVGLVLPAITLMTQSDPSSQYPFLAPVLNALGNPTRTQMVVMGMLILAVGYVLKAVFLSLITWRQMRYIFSLQADISQRLFAGYLRQPYVFHLQRNSAQLIRNTVGEISVMVYAGLIPAMTLITELAVVAGIAVLLFVAQPVGAFVALGVIGVTGWVYHRLTQDRISRWGKERQVHEGLRIQHVQQGLGGAKDAILLGREDDFLQRYRRHTLGSARVSQHQATLQQLPRFVLEAIAVIGLAALAMIMLSQGRQPEAMLPTLAVFVAAAFRLMPSLSRVISSVQSVRYAMPAVEVIGDELLLVDGRQASLVGPPLPFKKTLALDNVVFQYPSAEAQALHGISLSIGQGTSVGIIGGSGAGKSTLVDVILGLLTPKSGSVRVDGVDIHSNLRGWQNQIGYVPQSIFLTDDSLRRNVAFGLASDRIDEDAVRRSIRDAQLEDFVNELPQGLDTVVGERGVRLSGGQRQRIGIARALYHDPSVLVLDEATSSLDTKTEADVMRAVRALGGNKTYIIVSHRHSTVEHCQVLFRLDHGRLVNATGQPAEAAVQDMETRGAAITRTA